MICRTVLGALAVVACDSPREWSTLRDALTLRSGDALSFARGADTGFEPVVVVDVDSDFDGVEAVRAIDRARAEAGADALVAARYVHEGGRVVASDCGPLFVGGAVDLDGWLRRCGDGPAAIAAPAPGLPALVAWLPEEGRLLVHPALARAEVGLIGAPLIDAGGDCQADLEAWCQRCPTGTEAGCEPLFGPATPPVSCAEADANPYWRERYCVWRAIESDLDIRFLLAEAAWKDHSGACWDPHVPVTSVESLLMALPPWSPQCQREFQRGSDFDFPIEFGANGELGRAPLAECGSWLEQVYCETCASDRAGACVSLFEGSSGATDCYDLRRAEIHGGGFLALCALQRARGNDGYQHCVNAYDRCAANTDLQWSLTTKSFEELARALPGFFDADLVVRCATQAERCASNDPLPDFDPNATVPTPRTGEEGGAAGGNKCPQ